MVAKLVVLWTTPKDAEAFDEDYETTHMPLLGKLPSLTSVVASKALDGPYYRMTELAFPTVDSLRSSMGSAAGTDVRADAQRLHAAYGCKYDVLTVEESTRI